MSNVEYQRHDNRSDNEVGVSALLSRINELQQALDRWETRDDPEVGPYVRQSAIRSVDRLRAIASLATDLRERVQAQLDTWEVQHGQPLPGDEIRSRP